MKKIIIAGLLLFTALSFVIADQAADNRQRTDSFGINVLSTAVTLILAGSVDVVMEYQHAFSPRVSLLLAPEVAFGNGLWGVSSGIGLNVYPMGEYLKGLYISVLPVAGAISVMGDISLLYGAYARLGYEWISQGGFLFALGGGGRWDNFSGFGPNISMTMGYAW